MLSDELNQPDDLQSRDADHLLRFPKPERHSALLVRISPDFRFREGSEKSERPVFQCGWVLASEWEDPLEGSSNFGTKTPTPLKGGPFSILLP